MVCSGEMVKSSGSFGNYYSNVSTLDGYSTVHIIGIIKIIYPSDAVLADIPIIKCRSKSNAYNVAAVSQIPFLTWTMKIMK